MHDEDNTTEMLRVFDCNMLLLTVQTVTACPSAARLLVEVVVTCCLKVRRVVDVKVARVAVAKLAVLTLPTVRRCVRSKHITGIFEEKHEACHYYGRIQSTTRLSRAK